MVSTDVKKHKLDFFVKNGHIKLERGMVISKETMGKYPGDFPVYSSSIANNGLFGRYGKFMFDQEMLTWSVDGGGNIFYRPKHKFSVTNVSGILKLTSNKFIYKYLYYLLSLEHGRFTFDYVEKAHPSVIRNLYDIPDIDLEEQQKIAEILTTIDDAIEKTDAIIEKNKRIKQGLMQDLFRYGIDEHGNIRSEKTHKFKTVKIGNEEIRIPEEWEIKIINDIVEYVGSGVTPTGGSNVYTTEGIKFIRSQNVYFSGLKDDDIVYIDTQTNSKMKRSKILAFDVLLNITGASIGRCCVVPVNYGMANVNQHVCILRCCNNNNTKANYLSYYLESYFGQHQIDILNAGGNREGLNYQQIKSFIIRWQDPVEQFLITDILSDINHQIRKDKIYKKKLISLKRGLMEDLLTGKVRVNHLIKL